MARTRAIPKDPQTSTDKVARGLLRRSAKPKAGKRLTQATGARLGRKAKGGAELDGGAI